MADAAGAIGFPLAVKIQSAAIPHKTEAGGVRLGIADLPALHAAFDAVMAAAARQAPGAAIDGVLLERMAPRGVEMIVGVVRDPTFGPVVTVGAGGVATELFRDTAHRMAPVDEAEALGMVRSLRSAPLLEEFRGAPAADLPALTRLIVLGLADCGVWPGWTPGAGTESRDRPSRRAGMHRRGCLAGADVSAQTELDAMPTLAFAPPLIAPEAEALRSEVRTFLAAEMRDRTPLQRAESWSGSDPAFSRKMAQRGWIAMTWPKRYGGHERSALERYVVLEEMLAAGAPVGYHWIADRQSGPNILRYGTEGAARGHPAAHRAGECSFCIGMSEPDSGSDLAAARTRAVRAQAAGW